MTTTSQVTNLFECEDNNPWPKECGNCMDKTKQTKALSKWINTSVFTILNQGSFYAKPLQERKSSTYSTTNYPGKAKMLLYSYFQQNIFSVCSMSHYYVWDHMCGSAGGQVKVLAFTPSATESSLYWKGLLLIPLLTCFVLFNYLKVIWTCVPSAKPCLQFWGISNNCLKYQQHLELHQSRVHGCAHLCGLTLRLSAIAVTAEGNQKVKSKHVRLKSQNLQKYQEFLLILIGQKKSGLTDEMSFFFIFSMESYTFVNVPVG